MKRVVKDKAPESRGVERIVKEATAFRLTPRQTRATAIMAVAALVLAAAWWAYNSPYLTVQHVDVTGASQITPGQVRAAAGIEGASVLTLDLQGARDRVDALPKVAEVTVEKDGWNRVRIHVSERAPWGSWQINGVDVAVDVDGYILDGEAPAGSPVIVEVNPQRALNPGDRLDTGAVELAARLVNESERAFGRRVMALLYKRDSGLTVVLAPRDVNGKPVWVTFGDARDYDFKVASLYVLLEQATQQKLSLNTVDLRFGDRLSFN
jgi:cell division protein FtsQ